MSAIGVTPFKRHALHAWVPDSRHVSLSRCDGVYLLTFYHAPSPRRKGLPAVVVCGFVTRSTPTYPCPSSARHPRPSFEVCESGLLEGADQLLAKEVL